MYLPVLSNKPAFYGAKSRSILLILSSLLVAGCFEAKSQQCMRLTRIVEQAVQCIVAEERNQSLVAVDCGEYTDAFRALGLSSYDAEKIVDTNIDSFYKKFKGKDFCTDADPAWISRNVS